MSVNKVLPLSNKNFAIEVVNSVRQPSTKFAFSCNPFAAFGLNATLDYQGAIVFLKRWLGLEEQKYGSKGQENFRQNLVNEPFLNALPIKSRGFGQVETQKAKPFTNEDGSVGYTFPESVSVTRSRDYFSVPVTYIVWVIAIIIAYSLTRDQLMALTPTGQYIPQVMSEMLKKVRTASSGQYSYSMSKTPIPNVFGNIPQFKNTILDADFITTPEGYQLVLDFFTFLSVSPDCYVTMVQVGPDKSSVFPMVNSGQQVSHVAIDATPLSDGTGSVCISPHNSYPDAIKAVSITDAVLLGNSLSVLIDGSYRRLSSTGLGKKYDVTSLVSSQAINLVIERATGTMPNESYMDGDSVEAEIPAENHKSANPKSRSQRNTNALINRLIAVICDIFEISDVKKRSDYKAKLYPKINSMVKTIE